jgi:hypothetical protein
MVLVRSKRKCANMIPPVSSRMSVSLSARNYLKAVEWIFVKFYVDEHYRKFDNTFQVWLKCDKNNGHTTTAHPERRSKGKVVSGLNSLLRHEDVWWSGGIAPPFLTSASDGGEWSTSRPRRYIPKGYSLRHPLDRWLDGPQSRS